MKKFSSFQLGVSLLAAVAFTACEKPAEIATVTEARAIDEPIPGITFYALAGNMLDRFSTSNPGTKVSSAMITGLQAGERLVGIDFRPATMQLFGLGSNSRLYTINPGTGMATLVAALTTFLPGETVASNLMLSGTSFGFDFNPTVDRIRIISNTGQNLRANPINGITLVDGAIKPQPASVNGAAYDNNDTLVATGTELYVLEIDTDRMFELDPPNSGTLTEPRAIGLAISGEGGFDIAPRNATVKTDIGLALYQVDAKSTLFRIDVETGETKILNRYDNVVYTALAISPVL